MKLEIPLRYVKLLPLQGALLIGITTQGAALGYELLPLQGVLVAGGLHSCLGRWTLVQGVLVIRAFKAFALTGRIAHWHNNPGRCPGLRASAPSGRAGCMGACIRA